MLFIDLDFNHTYGFYSDHCLEVQMSGKNRLLFEYNNTGNNRYRSLVAVCNPYAGKGTVTIGKFRSFGYAKIYNIWLEPISSISKDF